jgi:hypothetical protein
MAWLDANDYLLLELAARDRLTDLEPRISVAHLGSPTREDDARSRQAEPSSRAARWWSTPPTWRGHSTRCPCAHRSTARAA